MISEKDKILAAWNSGLSYRKIASEYGWSVGKISGHLGRLRASGVKMRKVKPDNPVPPPNLPTPTAIPLPKSALKNYPDGTIGLRHHTDQMCKFIVDLGSTGEVLYCNHERLADKPYCSEHYKGKTTSR